MAGSDPPPGKPGEGSSRNFPPLPQPSRHDGLANFGLQSVVVRMEHAITGTKLPRAPFMLQRSVEAFLGEKVLDASSEGRGMSYALKIRNGALATKLMGMKNLSDGTPIKISTHPHRNSVRCVVSNFDVINDSVEQICSELASQGVIGVKRITRKENGIDVNTPTLILTIQGTTVPTSIRFGWFIKTTRPHYQLPMQCFRCWAFGHTKQHCSVDALCGNCGKKAHLEEGKRCEEPAYCNTCNNEDHATSSRKCPTYEKENNIQRIRTDRNMSYPQARKEWESCNGENSFAKVTARPTETENAITALAKKVDTLVEALAKSTFPQSHTSTDGRLAELEKKLEEVIADNKKKDLKIQELTNALRTKENATGAKRLELTRKYGTIEDLVLKVQNLESDLQKSQNKLETLTKNQKKESLKIGENNFDTQISDNEHYMLFDKEVFSSSESEQIMDIELDQKATKRTHSSSEESGTKQGKTSRRKAKTAVKNKAESSASEKKK